MKKIILKKRNRDKIFLIEKLINNLKKIFEKILNLLCFS